MTTPPRDLSKRFVVLFFNKCICYFDRSLGAIPCESLSSEPCWANMNTLSSGGGGGGGGSSSNSNSPGLGNNNNTASSSPTTTTNNNNNSTSSGGGGGGAGGSNGLHGPSASAGAIKKRRKSDTKPLSQINKCLNEKRRREQVLPKYKNISMEFFKKESEISVCLSCVVYTTSVKATFSLSQPFRLFCVFFSSLENIKEIPRAHPRVLLKKPSGCYASSDIWDFRPCI